MFTGIISHIVGARASQRTGEGLLMTFEKPEEWGDLELGESVATNGVCLTVTAIREKEYDCVVVPETLDKSSFGTHVPEVVNVERALQVGDRLSGHIVQGHVDTVGKVAGIETMDGYRISIEFPPSPENLVISKGSVCVDGVALTVATTHDKSFEVAIIPFTLRRTTLNSLKVGDEVNLEFDVVGKYVAKILEQRSDDAKS